MYQVIDTKTGKVIAESLSLRAAEIRLNAQCMLPSDWMRFVIRYKDFNFRTGEDR